MSIEAIDLFCGAGGLTRGLIDVGIKVKAGFDIDKACKHAYEANNKGARFHLRDVAQVTGDDLAKLWSKKAVRLLAGCAPCQPFSPAAASAERDEDDPRYDLLNHFARLVRETLPELVTMENVPRVRGHKPFSNFVAALKGLKYEVWYGSVKCEELGIPQTRRRLVLLASRIGSVPKGVLKPPLAGEATVEAALAGLPSLEAGQRDQGDAIHFARSLTPLNLQRIRACVPGGTWKDWPKELRSKCHRKSTGASYKNVYARMADNAPSPTITTMFYNFGTGRFGHPTQDRAISPREAALLQSFPRDYNFVAEGQKVHLAMLGRLIGNAVPPKLGSAIGSTLNAHVKAIGMKARADARVGGRRTRRV